MKYRLLRNFLKGCSLTTALFVFQACYGTAQGLDWEVRDINFRVLNTEGAALEKAKVLMKETVLSRNGKTAWKQTTMVLPPLLATIFPPPLSCLVLELKQKAILEKILLQPLKC